MEKRLKNIVVSVVIFSVLFGLMMPVQAPGYAVGGWIFDTDGTTPAADVNVTVTCIETTQSVFFTTEDDGRYVVTLGGGGYNPPSAGDTLRLFADAGDGRTNTTEVTATGTSPQLVNLTLVNDTTPPTVEFIPPTPVDGSTNTTGHVNFTVNVTEPAAGGRVDIVNISVWNEAGIYLNNGTMYAFDEHKYYYDTKLPNGNYTYKAYAKDVAGNTGVSETRVLTVNKTGFSIEFFMDYNIISMPVNDTSVQDAVALAAKIGGDCTQISKWDAVNQIYVTYLPAMGIDNFDIVGGEGYEVVMTGSATVTFTGKGWESPFTVSLLTDYNIIGIPVNDTSVPDAVALATKIGDNCTQISKWDAVNQTYVTYLPAMGIDNFDIAGGEGYEVVMTSPTSVIFEGEPWSD